ncbi:MAG: T9SS type A sorting domain-containing protein [Taibaiella sp.]|nr:T9SS type A sorting domain-containing protein [Taibaiella sp.]
MKLKSILLALSVAATASVYAQSEVSTGGQKYVLLEEGTGCWCGYCPDGSQRIQQTIEPSYPRMIPIAFHNGDPMALSPDDFNNTYIGSGGPGWPGATVDRTVFTHDYGSSGIKTMVGHNRGFWNTDVGVQYALAPKFDVRMISTYDTATRVVKVKVTAKVLAAPGAGPWRINAYIVEDSISSDSVGYEQDNYMTSSPSTSWYYGYPSPISPGSRYAHMGVVRKILAAGGSMWGDTAAFAASPAIGDSISRNYTYTIPATSFSKYVRVVGVIQKYGATKEDRAVQNTIMARVRLMQKVYPSSSSVASNVKVIEEMELFPNPAKNVLTVRGMLEHPAEVNLTVFDALGRQVFNQSYPAGGSLFAENVGLDQMSNGIYFMNITSDGATVTKQFIVNR